VNDFVSTKNAYLGAFAPPKDGLDVHSELKAMVNLFTNHIKLCQTFWRVISLDLPFVNPIAKFTVTAYQQVMGTVFVNHLLSSFTQTSCRPISTPPSGSR
jgi:hypothetical protein